MSKTDKLLAKLKNGTIDANELRTLLSKLGWVLDRQSGSHEQWIGPKEQRLTLAAQGKELRRYLIKETQEKI